MSSFNLDIDLLPINVIVYKKQNNNFVFFAFNKEAERTETRVNKELLGCDITDFITDAKASGLLNAMHRVELTGQKETIHRAIYVDKKKVWRNNELVKLEPGLVAIFNKNCFLDNHSENHDFQLEQELNEAEKLLEHQKKMFQHIMENSESISVQGYNEKHEVIYWNHASEKIYGYTAEEACGEKLETLIIPEFMRQAVFDGVESWLYDDVAPISSELTLKNKEGHDVHVYSEHIMIKVDTRHTEMYCIDIDLHEIKQLQNELITQRNFLRTIFDVIPDLIWLQDVEGKYLACNTMFERFIGVKEADIIGKTAFDFLHIKSATLFREKNFDHLDVQSSRSNERLVFADNSHQGLFETIKTPMLDVQGNTTGVVGVSRDITEHKKKEEQLKTFAHFDMLTGLVNRSLFLERLTQLTKQRKQLGVRSAVLFIDLDHFKEINDTKGHSIGDQVLIVVAQRLNDLLRKGDTLARFGGDEFTVLLESIKSPIDASNVAQAMINVLKEPLLISHYQFYLTMSIGITIYPDDGEDPESLLRFADTAMYKAKENGRNSFEFYTKELSRKAFERVLLENNLRRAIANNEFVLYYQPQVDAVSQEMIGAEALIRWDDPRLGIITPYKFIAAAEASGLILEIGRWVLYQAMKDMAGWRAKGVNIETVSINLSVKQLNDTLLINTITQALEQTRCAPQWVEFEVTEGYAMNDPERAIVLLERIRDLGCKISLDDFGTGYSSLAYLKRLPVKKLKIDQSFVRDIPGDRDDEAIVKAVILIAQSMHLEVIAEGVENVAQQAFLLEQGCQYSQGYFYAKPMPKKQFEKYCIKDSHGDDLTPD